MDLPLDAARLAPSDALLVVDVQASFPLPAELIEEIRRLTPRVYTVATIERHDESVTPFERELGWKPNRDDDCLVEVARVFIKHGYLPPPSLIEHLRARSTRRVFVCGIQADTCCLAAGFALFDAGLRPTLLKWLTVGSSLDRTADLGARLWRHHFGPRAVLEHASELSSIT